MKYPAKHVISLSVVLFLLWLGLSGHWTPLLLSLGIAFQPALALQVMALLVHD